MPGSFRTAAAQAVTGQATLTHADRPASVPEDGWLAPGEWIRYWTQMPYGLAGLIAEAATIARLDTAEIDDPNPMNREARRAARRRGGPDRAVRVNAEFKPARASMAAFALGLVGWSIRDENDQPVEFVPFDLTSDNWINRVQALRSALPTAVVDTLDELIDSEAKAPLDMKAPGADHEGDTEGNAFGGS